MGVIERFETRRQQRERLAGEARCRRAAKLDAAGLIAMLACWFIVMAAIVTHAVNHWPIVRHVPGTE